jgi:hypothetical protein
MKSDEFDRAFDDGEDVTSQLDISAARRPGLEQRRVNVDFPSWMIESLDREARRLGVNRQSIIKVWIAERLERGASPALRVPVAGSPGSPKRERVMAVLREVCSAVRRGPAWRVLAVAEFTTQK